MSRVLGFPSLVVFVVSRVTLRRDSREHRRRQGQMKSPARPKLCQSALEPMEFRPQTIILTTDEPEYQTILWGRPRCGLAGLYTAVPAPATAFRRPCVTSLRRMGPSRDGIVIVTVQLLESARGIKSRTGPSEAMKNHRRLGANQTLPGATPSPIPVLGYKPLDCCGFSCATKARNCCRAVASECRKRYAVAGGGSV